ncbi:Putative auto-transporter adhesin, head GIN domain [Microbacterium sp. cf046]|uniref:head GIN domain-containing protein n=1 Tax=Microbacterium sp. cf046 TaxID=1761803 RepID=UPI0008E14D95|nr:head GIN domain-containing protein [Microbacterium sp. cf046]SFS14279.1 Putative auto-transporter adhesin, head GIN domain [Microbacterium sp. cf046]
MRTVRTIAAVVIAASVLVVAGCMPLVASGPMTSEEREIDAVAKVVLDTSGDLSIKEGEPRLVIRASESALERLTSEVSGDTLVLGTTPGPVISLGDVSYELTLPDLESIEVNGSGDIDSAVSAEGTIRLDIDGSGDLQWSGLDAERVEIRVAGSGEVEMSGRTAELAIELDGSGSIDVEALKAQDAVVSISGSGDIDVSASDSLAAEISGSGRITYSGDPTVDADISGSGEVVSG